MAAQWELWEDNNILRTKVANVLEDPMSGSRQASQEFKRLKATAEWGAVTASHAIGRCRFSPDSRMPLVSYCFQNGISAGAHLASVMWTCSFVLGSEISLGEGTATIFIFLGNLWSKDLLATVHGNIMQTLTSNCQCSTSGKQNYLRKESGKLKGEFWIWIFEGKQQFLFLKFICKTKVSCCCWRFYPIAWTLSQNVCYASSFRV